MDITCAVIRWKSVFYQSTKHGAELKLPRPLPIRAMSNHFSDFSNLKVRFRNKRAGK